VTLDFVDLLPAALRRTPVKHIAVGNDPQRIPTPMDAAARAAFTAADAILLATPSSAVRQKVCAPHSFSSSETTTSALPDVETPQRTPSLPAK